MQWKGPLALSMAGALWGGMFVVSKVLLETVPPFVLAWLTYLLGAATLAVIALVKRQRWRLAPRDVPLLLVVTLAGYVISVAAQFLGTRLATAQLGAVVTASTPAFIVVFAVPILGERLTPRKVLAVLAASAGMVAIVGVGHLSGSERMGGAILMMTAIGWGLMSVVAKLLFQRMAPMMVTLYAMSWSLLFLAPLAGLELKKVSWPAIFQLHMVLGILYLGIMATAAAYFLWNYGLSRMPAGVGGVYMAMQPVVGTLLGWWLLHEPVGLGTVLGFILIVVGIGLTVWEAGSAATPPVCDKG